MLARKRRSWVTEQTTLDAWVERARSGDLSALEEVIRRTQALVRKTAFPLVRRDQLEDVVQETYLVVHQRIHQLQKVEAFKAWLCRIAIHVAHSVRKKTPLTVVAREDDRSQDQTAGLARKMDLRAALAELKESDRNILIMRDMLGFSYEEVAYALKLPLGTVRSRIHYSRKKLKQKMEG